MKQYRYIYATLSYYNGIKSVEDKEDDLYDLSEGHVSVV